MPLHHDAAFSTANATGEQRPADFCSGRRARPSLRGRHCTGATVNAAERNDRQLALELPPRVNTPSGSGFLVRRITEALGLVRFDGVPKLRTIAGCLLLCRLEDVEVLA
jgi:hypothetical protein